MSDPTEDSISPRDDSVNGAAKNWKISGDIVSGVKVVGNQAIIFQLSLDRILV